MKTSSMIQLTVDFYLHVRQPLLPVNLDMCGQQHSSVVMWVAQGQPLNSSFLRLNRKTVGWELKLFFFFS